MIRTLCAVMLAVFAPASADGGEGAARRFSLVTPEGKTEGMPALDLSDGPKIVVWSSPSDSAAKSALEILGREAAARAALMTRALFLAPANEAGSLPAANAAGPYEYAVPYSAADWPEISGSGPRAHFYTVTGPVCVADLTAEDPAAAFRLCMDRSGLLATAARLDTVVRLTWLDIGGDAELEEAKRLLRDEAAALLREGAFRPEAISALTDAALTDAYNVVDNANFRKAEKGMAAVQASLLTELKKRGLAGRGKITDMHEVLLDAREFDEAESFRAAHPGLKLQAVPAIKGAASVKGLKRPVYALDNSAKEMRVLTEDLRGPRIIIAAAPGCHFAVNALKDIEKEPGLLETFEKYGLPLTDEVDFESIVAWNRARRLKYRLAVARKDWPDVDFMHSPTIQFMRDGETVYRIGGWYRDSFIDDVYRGLGYLFFGGVQAPAKEEAKQGGGGRTEGPLGNFLRGLALEQKRGFCSSLSYSDGVFAGADFSAVKEVLGERKAAALREYIAGPSPTAVPPSGKARTFGELLAGLGARELVRTCETISFFDGRFGGLRHSDIQELSGGPGIGEVMGFFSPPRKKKE